MILEQAFIALPEFLVGTGFTKYDAEGTLVMAYAMSVLQELNGRNVNNPISLISSEKAYPKTKSRTADLHLDYQRVGTLNDQLQAFGAREENWLEAKFFRKNNGKPTLDTTKGAYALLRDLLRLSILPPQEPSKPAKCNRFLLHVYEGNYLEHLSLDRNKGDNKRESRGWLTGLHLAGIQKINVGDLSPERSTFDTEVGKEIRGV